MLDYPTILRQERRLTEETAVELQPGSRILAVRMLRPSRQQMYNMPYFEFWYTGLINPPTNTLKDYTIFVVGTGQPVPARATRYIETAVYGDYIWHFWTDEPAEAPTSGDVH